MPSSGFQWILVMPIVKQAKKTLKGNGLETKTQPVPCIVRRALKPVFRLLV